MIKQCLKSISLSWSFLCNLTSTPTSCNNGAGMKWSCYAIVRFPPLFFSVAAVRSARQSGRRCLEPRFSKLPLRTRASHLSGKKKKNHWVFLCIVTSSCERGIQWLWSPLHTFTTSQRSERLERWCARIIMSFLDDTKGQQCHCRRCRG